MPIEQVRPGMVGYGLTVFSGFKVERFRVEVIDVMKNFLPKQDLFLVRVDHPVLRKTGVVGGMSGSPIYLEGKLAGALAYGWRFAKEPICGITPIKDMLALFKRKLRGPILVSSRDAPHRQPLDRSSLTALARARHWWKLPFSPPPSNSPSLAVPVAIPINLAGFSEIATTQLKEAFAAYGFEPVQGGGTGKSEGPTQYEPGGAIGLQLVSGDMSMAGTGTVTLVDHNKILGFGHRMFNAGEIYIPAVTAKVHHTLASLSRSFKIASPARTLGSLVQDLQAGIFVDTSKQTTTIPMTVTMRFMGQKHHFSAELARHPLLTPTLAVSVLSSALSEAIPDVTEATFRVATRFSIKGYPPVVIEDFLASPSGVAMTAPLSAQGLRALREVMTNEFEPVQIERLDLDVEVEFGNKVLEVSSVGLSSNTVDPESRVNLTVSFQPYHGREFTKSYPLYIPAYLAGSLLKLEVGSGAAIKPELAPPQNMRQFLEFIQRGYPARSLVISLSTPDNGLKIRGEVIQDLPSSVIDSLSTGANVRSEQQFQTIINQVHTTRSILVGKKTLRLRVKNEVTP